MAAGAPCAASSVARVGRADLDMNRHANNAAYIRWLLEDAPAAVHEGAVTAGADLEFRAEARDGDDVLSRCSLLASDGRCLAHEPLGGGPFSLQHVLLRGRDGAELLRARTHWRLLRGGPPETAVLEKKGRPGA